MKQAIIKHIQKNGPLKLADYMAMCLYDPQHGYYMNKTPFGQEGDFITAPELTPLFGEMLGLWVADTWQNMGAPTAFNLVELGPGRGVLCADMLRAIQKAAPACLKACQVHLVEVSPHLIALQKQTLKNAPCSVMWHTDIQAIRNAAPSVVVGNELLDALPVNQYEQTDGKHYYERLVNTDGQNLFFTHATAPTTNLPKQQTPIIEHSPDLDSLLNTLKTHIQQGAVLLLDYGTTKAPEGTGETLQAIRNHQHEGIFAAPGQADLTWHINFTNVFGKMGADHCMVTDMALFLSEIGLPLRAEQAHRAAKTNAAKKHIEQTTHRLLDPNQMGQHFKVLGWKSHKDLHLSGFMHYINKIN